MPPFVRAIAFLLIGIPGGLMWIVGMVSCLFSSWALVKCPPGEQLPALIFLAGSVVCSAIGFAMVATVEMINGGKRYRMPRARLPGYLGLELLEGLLAVAVVGGALAAMCSLADKKAMLCLVWTLFEAIMILLLVTTHRTLRSKGSIWRAESTSPIGTGS
ncbi:hypothetical protein [Luteolibacter soli]|uniref:Uncharacterized protein n=1 Tax=Luteolibacter soli TaxID=3135280 RepID=A0ABU9AYW1_9BACT